MISTETKSAEFPWHNPDEGAISNQRVQLEQDLLKQKTSGRVSRLAVATFGILISVGIAALGVVLANEE